MSFEPSDNEQLIAAAKAAFTDSGFDASKFDYVVKTDGRDHNGQLMTHLEVLIPSPYANQRQRVFKVSLNRRTGIWFEYDFDNDFMRSIFHEAQRPGSKLKPVRILYHRQAEITYKLSREFSALSGWAKRYRTKPDANLLLQLQILYGLRIEEMKYLHRYLDCDLDAYQIREYRRMRITATAARKYRGLPHEWIMKMEGKA